MISRFFIDRPIFATVVSLIIVLAGLVSMNNLPIEQYPNLTPPTIMVRAVYPGASAETQAETVVAPIEDKINGVDGMIYMNSTSSGNNGESNINVYFKVGTDPDMAMVNVNNRVQQATTTLPEECKKYGVTVLKRSPSILQVMAFYCNNGRYNNTYVGNYVLLNVVDELKRIDGVGEANAMAGNTYCMRIWLQPDKLSKLNLSAAEVVAAIQAQNSQKAAGAVGKEPMSLKVDRNYLITAEGRYTTEKQFEDIIIRAFPDGRTLRLKDIAKIELGSQSYDMIAKTIDGFDATPIMISLAPGANALATAERIAKKMEELKKGFPEGITYKTIVDTTGFVKNSISEVSHTLFEAILLVVLVIFVFLKKFRATLIPCLAVPVSIIGAFAGMILAGFSINTLTLFGLVLAIGIVVDDAIVVIENVERIMRTEGLSVRDATIKAMDEVTGALIAIVLVLCAVFVPVGFMGGLAGTMYKQFAITIAVSVVISGICALTLTPALCVIFLESSEKGARLVKFKENRFFEWFDNTFAKLTDKYVAVVAFFTRHVKSSCLTIGSIIVASILMFKLTPGALVPDEDQGTFITALIMDPASTIKTTEAAAQKVAKAIASDPNVKDCLYAAGFDILSSSASTSGGTLFSMMKDWSVRPNADQSVSATTKKVMGMGYQMVRGGSVFSFGLPAIIGLSMTGGIEGYLQKTGDTDSKALEEKAREFVATASKRPELTQVQTTFNASTPQLKMVVDELKALSLGVSIADIYVTIGTTFNTFYVNDFSKAGRGFRVMVQAEDKYRAYPDQLNEAYVKSRTGAMIPLSAFVKFIPTVGPTMIERYNMFFAAKIMATPAPGYSSGQAIQAMEEVAHEVGGSEYSFSWTGSAYQEKENGGSSYDALLLGIVVVFLILAALYERWTLPISVLLAVPFAMFGAILAVYLRGLSNDIYFQVALITLVGLSAKNAILIVEFAVMFKKQGMELVDSAIKAAKLRFRPIIMTSFAFILGCVPLALSSGAGSASRHAIGTSVIGGMLGATILAPLFVPLFFVLVTKMSERVRGGIKNA
ncbi:MAG: multidrug efflux RND transporter permease subunit [Alphaproteobacteria bacterium]|nr:multidrug efflux RND transporter permease subunit [Alphaproteobacteria bacterium]